MRRWQAYLAWGLVLIAVVAALVGSSYRSRVLAAVSVWGTFLAIVFAVWSFVLRANRSHKDPRGFDVLGQPLKTLDEVIHPGGDHRLVLRFVEEPLPGRPRHRAYNFHSLLWLARTGDAWTERVRITPEAFEQDAHRRWPIAVHSIDPAAGTAILNVGEEHPPDASGFCDVRYSWREWDLIANRQVRLLRTCADPFERFDRDPRESDAFPRSDSGSC